MELIPIIYTVLKIVAVLAVAAISISYVIYKIKQKRGQIEGPVAKYAQPVVSVEKKVRNVVNRLTHPIPHQPKEKKEMPVEKPKAKPVAERNPGHPSKKKPSPAGERIEIIKNISPNRAAGNSNQNDSERPVPHSTEEKKLNSLGDEIIDKYTNGEEDEFYRLNIKNNKKD